MKHSLHTGIGLVILIALCATTAIAAETRLTRYPLPDHGGLQCSVPASWKETVQQPPKRLPPTITFSPKVGKPFMMLVTPMWQARRDAPPISATEIRKQVQQAAQDATAQAVEKTINVMEFKAATGMGYCFSATDSAPEPGGYKYLTQGMLPLGELLVSFTILTNDGQQQTIADALSMLATATCTTTGAEIPIPNEGWAIEFDSPFFTERKDARKGTDYTFVANAGSFNMSLFVEQPHGNGQSHADCYQYYWPLSSRDPLIMRDTIVASHTEKYYRVQCDTAVQLGDQQGRQRHVHYYFVFQGRWVDIHISIIAPTKEDDAIIAAFDKSLTYGKTVVPAPAGK